MLTEERFVKFQGFHPSEYTRSYLDEMMSELYEEAPYGATLQATFTRHNEEFKGLVRIHSSAGKFFAVASGPRIKDVTHHLVEQIRRQLNKWKSQRFQPGNRRRELPPLGA